MRQFNNLLYQLGKGLNWDIQLSILPRTGELKEDKFPLSPSTTRYKEDVIESQGSLQGFIGRINTLNRR